MLNSLWESFSTKKSAWKSRPVMEWNQILLISFYQLPLAWKEYHLFDDFFEIYGYPPTPQEIRPPSSLSKASSLTHWLIYKKLLAPVPAYAVGPPSQNLWHSLREETSAHGDCANGRLRRFKFVNDHQTDLKKSYQVSKIYTSQSPTFEGFARGPHTATSNTEEYLLWASCTVRIGELHGLIFCNDDRVDECQDCNNTYNTHTFP